MSTTAVRMSHISSPSYVPRSASASSSSHRPASPSLPPPPASLPHPPHHAHGPSHGHGGHGHARSASLPGSPVLTPRLADMERRGSSHLRNEVTEHHHYSLGPAHGQSQLRSQSIPRSPHISQRDEKDMSEGAKAILKILSSLPAPLPESLPPTFLPTPNTTPSPPTQRSFSDYVHSSSSASGSSSSSPTSSLKRPLDSESSNTNPLKSIGLGLGLSMDATNGGVKKRKLSTSPPSLPSKPNPPTPTMSRSTTSHAQVLRSPELHRSVSASALTPRISERGFTPSIASPSSSTTQLTSSNGAKKEVGKSSLRHEVSDQELDAGEGSAGWSRQKWHDKAQAYRGRAVLLKRHGDAYSRAPSAHSQYVAQLPRDPLRGLLCLTDAVLLWLYAYFCEEQGIGRIRHSEYRQSEPLRDFVRKGWEAEMRRGGDDQRREMARAMVGLMNLVEAVVSFHLVSDQMTYISKRAKDITHSSTNGASGNSGGANGSGASASASGGSNHGPSPSSTNSASPPGPSPHSNHGSGGASSSPESHSSQSQNQSISDLLPIITGSTASFPRSQTFLQTSRHHLTLKVLKQRFPETYQHAVNSDLADEALPAPGDNLGSAKRLDVDSVERFAWPIELGMVCPTAHTAVFGRCMVAEFGRTLGGWDVKLEP